MACAFDDTKSLLEICILFNSMNDEREKEDFVKEVTKKVPGFVDFMNKFYYIYKKSNAKSSDKNKNAKGDDYKRYTVCNLYEILDKYNNEELLKKYKKSDLIDMYRSINDGEKPLSSYGKIEIIEELRYRRNLSERTARLNK